MFEKLTNSVDVILTVVGVVVVDDELHIIDIQSSSSHISGNQDGGAAALELPQHPVSLLLLFVTVNTHSRPAITSHQPEGNVDQLRQWNRGI